MAFWGIELKPGKPYTHDYDETRGRLRVSQATLGTVVGAKGAKTEAKTTVQCNVGKKSPVLICSLFSEKCETCHLELEFEEEEEVVFSVLGQRSVHLSGYYIGDRNGNEEPLGEDIAETESEDSDYNEISDEDEYESDFIDDSDDIPMFDDASGTCAPSRPHKSGVIIEEIFDEEEPANGEKTSLAKKKKRQVSDSDDAAADSQLQITVVPASSAQVDSEDEDGFPISDSKKTEEGKEGNKKRKIDDSAAIGDDKMEEDSNEVAKKKKKSDKKSKKKEKGEKGSLPAANADIAPEVKAPNDGKKPKGETTDKPTKGDAVPEESPVSKKITDTENDHSCNSVEKESKKKKKKNKKIAEKDQGKKEEKNEKDEKKETQQSRTFGNGLVVEEISMGRPDGKKATPGSKVSVNYIGKLQNGKIFDSNVGQRPFKFRLGVGQVIKGWDVGVSGMRVGDRRRLTIPPAMGYGDKSMGKIPKNSWLIFDVELTNVQ